MMLALAQSAPIVAIPLRGLVFQLKAALATGFGGFAVAVALTADLSPGYWDAVFVFMATLSAVASGLICAPLFGGAGARGWAKALLGALLALVLFTLLGPLALTSLLELWWAALIWAAIMAVVHLWAREMRPT